MTAEKPIDLMANLRRSIDEAKKQRTTRDGDKMYVVQCESYWGEGPSAQMDTHFVGPFAEISKAGDYTKNYESGSKISVTYKAYVRPLFAPEDES